MRDEPRIFEKESVQYFPDITSIKDGKIALMVIKIDACSTLLWRNASDVRQSMLVEKG